MAMQLPLKLSLREASTFANFLPGRNREVLDGLMRFLSAPSCRVFYMSGETGTGKTHLLEAACLSVGAGESAYVPLGLANELAPDLLEGLEAQRLICLDDAQAIVGRPEWESALFALHERMRAGRALVVAGTSAPRHLGLRLPDLATRLGAGLVYHLLPLQDREKVDVLRGRALARGLELSAEGAAYLLARHPRDMHALTALLDRIDEAALAQQRALTIPFLRAFA